MADETTSIALPRKIRFLLISFIFVIFAVTVLTLNYHPVDPVPRNPTPFLKSWMNPPAANGSKRGMNPPAANGSKRDTTVRLEGCTKWVNECSTECMNRKGKINRSVFYVKVDNHFGIVEWLAMMSAIKFLKPDDVTVYSAGVIKGCWWRRIRSFITHKLIPEHAWVTELNGNKVKEPAHKSDFLRMEVLYRRGGIYMDTDIIVLKSFDSLLDNQIVLAEESKAVPNVAVMLARNRSCFMCHFMKLACHKFDGSWAGHSVFALADMYRNKWKQYNGAVLLPQREGFYAFHWSELHELYEVDMKDITLNVSQAYAIHLYNHISAGYLIKLSDFKWISENQSPAARAFRAVLPEGLSEKHLDENLCLDLP